MAAKLLAKESLVRLGLELVCPVCLITFRYCEHCWRGHKYCSPACSHEGRKRNRRITEKKYCSTDKGILSRRKRQKNFRSRKILGLKVTDHSPQSDSSKINSSQLNKEVSKKCCSCLKSIQLITPGGTTEDSEEKNYFSFVRFLSKNDCIRSSS